MAVYLSVSPPDGFQTWSEPDWDDWLDDHPWEPAELLAQRGEWLVFLYQSRVHAPRSQGALGRFMDRLMNERPVPAGEVAALRDAFEELARELSDVRSTKLWTGTQFYSPDELTAMIEAAERRTNKLGMDVTVADLWQPLLDRLRGVFERALAEGRGVYFGNV
jgi:hypothetical protein